MPLPRSLEGVLMRTIVEARYEGMFNLLDSVRRGGRWPLPFDEHVPGTVFSFDDTPPFEFKGQAFVPHMVYQDTQGKPIRGPSGTLTEASYVDRIKRALAQDNMTVQTHTGPVSGVRIPNERFERIGMMIVESKKNIHRQKEKLPEHYPRSPLTDDIVRSYLPPVQLPPGGIGTKATLTSMLAVGAWKMRSYVDFYRRDLNMAPNGDDPRFAEFYSMMRESQEPIVVDGTLLANPHIVVAHASPYLYDAVTGLTRILGFRGTKKNQNRLGEFETLSFERATTRVLRTLPGISIAEDDVWAYNVPPRGGRRLPIIGVHRWYAPTEPGKRPTKSTYRLVRPEDFGLDPHGVRERAAEKLNLEYVAPVR